MLEPLTIEDLELVLQWRNQPVVRNNMYTSHEISAEEHKAWFAGLKNDPSRKWYVYSVEGEKYGVVYFTQCDEAKGNAFWGFYSGENAPLGTGLRMELEALELAFEVFGLHKLNCEVIAHNSVVVNMHKKVGFEEEGCFRDFYFDGEQYHDVIRLGMLAVEWPLCKEKLSKRLSTRKMASK